MSEVPKGPVKFEIAIHLIAKYARVDGVKAIEHPLKFIELLVRAYNEKKRLNGKEGHIFRKIETPEWNRKEHGDAFLIAYCSKRSSVTRPAGFITDLTGKPRGTYQDVYHHFVFFVYFAVKGMEREVTRKKTETVWAVFALTSNQAFRLVRPHCDYAFPLRMAFRMVEPSCLKKDINPLVGAKEASTSYYKSPYDFKTHEYESLWTLYKNFDSALQPGCSLLSLLGVSKQMGMHIGEGMIRIGSSLPFGQYVSLLPHFLNIRRGKPTYKSDGTLEEDDSTFQIFANIQRVKFKEGRMLDECLVDVLWKAITQDDFSSTLYLSHRRFRDYYRSTEFELRILNKGGSYRVLWRYRPTFQQVVMELRRFYHHHSLSDFQKEVDSLSMICDRVGGSFHPLLEFIQGELVLEEDVYFKIGGVWLKVLGQHLATTERAFRTVVVSTLARQADKGAHILRTPWISKEGWVAFSAASCPEEVSLEDYNQTMETLQDKTFQFVDDAGKVQLPYLTRAILQDQGIKMVKSLKKKWEELRRYLEENHGKMITAQGLAEVFTNKHKEVFVLLKKPYPVCRALQTREGTAAAVSEEGRVLIKDLKLFEMPKSAPKGISRCVDAVSELLGSQETVTEESLSQIMPPRCSGSSALRWLKQKHSLHASASSRYVFQGPVPAGVEIPDSLRAFFQERHEQFRLVMDEENYSRLFLGKKDYLVFDQVFPGKRDKIELFDLVYLGEKGVVYLYAIKEGVGSSTGIACTQLRLAAEAIHAARTTREGRKLLGNLYDTAISTEAKSAFRKQLIEDLKKIPKKEFIDLFCNRKVVFVYAFLDTNKEDRRLEDEVDLKISLPLGGLRKATSSQSESEEQLLRDLLVAMGYLDSGYRLTGSFIRSQSKKIQEEFKPFAERVWKELIGYTTRREFFRKLEVRGEEARGALVRALIQLGYLASRGTTPLLTSSTKDSFVKKLICFDPKGVYKIMWRMLSQFDSMIAKIELIKIRSDLEKRGFTLQIQQLNRPGSVASRPLFNLVDSQTERTSFLGMSKVAYQGEDYYYRAHPKTLREVFSRFMGQEDPYLAQRIFYQMSEESDDDLLDPALEMTEDMVKEAASLSGTLLVIYDIDTPPEAQESDAFTLIIKRGSSYFYPNEIEVPLLDSQVAVEEILDTIDEGSLPDAPVGIKNRGNDCFLNAMLQLLLHSPLFVPLITKRTCEPFLSFVLQYVEGEALPSTWQLRAPLELSEYGQEDVQEAFTKLLDLFDLDGEHLPILEIDKEIDEDAAESFPEKDPEKFSPLEEVLHTETPCPILSFPIVPGEKPGLLACWDAFETQELEEPLSYSQGGEVLGVPSSQATYAVQNEPDTLLVHLLRYQYDKEKKAVTKIKTPVDIPDEFIFGDSTYELGGFINHVGAIPQQGHYTCHLKKGETWFSCDDTTVKEQADIADPLSQAYVLMFRKVS